MRIRKEMPKGWTPGRCIVECDMNMSCPFSRGGCWVKLPVDCPLYREYTGTLPAVICEGEPVFMETGGKK